jgi:hypothetical protein
MVTTTDGMSSVFSDGWAGFCGVAALMILLGTGKDTIRLSTTIADIARAERQGMAFLERSTPIVSICLSAAGTSQVIPMHDSKPVTAESKPGTGPLPLSRDPDNRRDRAARP